MKVRKARRRAALLLVSTACLVGSVSYGQPGPPMPPGERPPPGFGPPPEASNPTRVRRSSRVLRRWRVASS